MFVRCSSRLALGATALMLIACATRTSDDDLGRAEGLARAERAFAASAATSGVKTAFLGVLSEHATLFRPGPVDGRRHTASRPDPSIRLAWQPQRVSVSASGDLGYSTGPYRLASTASPEQPSYGQFFSIWKRTPAGRWELLIDHGIEHSGPYGWDLPLDIVAAAPSAATTSIVDAEAAFAEAARSTNALDVYRQFGSTHVRLLRDGFAPFDGLSSLAALPDAAARIRWTLSDSGEGLSHDLAWTMGRYRSAGPGVAGGSGFYVRVWQVEGTRWKILSEVLAPLDEAAG